MVTIAGIALGVAIFFGVNVSNKTVDRGFDRFFQSIAGNADLVARPLGASGPTLADGLVDRIAREPGVEATLGGLTAQVSAQPSSSRVSWERDLDPERLHLWGTDLARFRSFYDMRVLAGRLPRTGAREIAIQGVLGARFDLSVGDTLPLALRPGAPHVPFRVVGVLEGTAITRGVGGVMITSLEQARALAGKRGVLSEIDIQLADGVDTKRWLVEHRAALGPGVDVVDRSALVAPFVRMFRESERGFGAVSTVALFVGVFLIYLTLSMAVLERTRLFGLLAALGTGRNQLRRLVVSEALAMGVVGSLAGLVLGLGVATGLVRLTARLVYVDVGGLVVTPLAVVLAIFAGLAMTLVASLIPARRAARLTPVEALRADHEGDGRLSRWWLVGIACVVVGFGLVPAAGSSALVPAAAGLVMLGSVLLVPAVLRPLARVLGRVTSRLAGGVGEVSVMHLAKERSRSAFTLALVMVVMAMAISMGAGVLAVRQAHGEQLDAQLGADVTLHVGEMPSAGVRKVGEVSGVAAVTPVRRGGFAALLADRPDLSTRVQVIEPTSYFRVSGFAWTDGDDDSVSAALARGGSVVLPESTAREMNAGVGDTVRLVTEKGPRPFVVVGRYLALLTQPDLVIGPTDARRWFRIGAPEELQVDVASGHDVYGTIDKIMDSFAPGPGNRAATAEYIGVQPGTEVKAAVARDTARYTKVFYSILGVAVLIGLLGLANTLAMSVLERRREIGVLRAVGTHRRGVAAMVLVESATLVLVAYVLALPLGALLSSVVVGSIADGLGFGARFLYPWGMLPPLAVLGAVVALAAAFIPARRAARLDPVAALRFE